MHLAVARDTHLHTVERQTVIHTAAACLAHPIGADNPDAGGTRLRQQIGRCSSATEQHRVKAGQLAELTGPRQPVQMSRHERHIFAGTVHRCTRLTQSQGILRKGRFIAGEDGTHHDLEAGDVQWRQCEQPLPGATESFMGCRRRGDQRGARQHDVLRMPAAAGGADNQGNDIFGRVEPSTQHCIQRPGVAGERAKRSRHGVTLWAWTEDRQRFGHLPVRASRPRR